MRANRSSRAVAAGLAAILTACVGGEGPQGPAGPPGPPADRSKLYCRNSAATLNASNLTTSIFCDSRTDIPWQGACEAPELPTDMYLSRSEPVNWENMGELPGWTCTWAAWGAVPNQNFGANAELCCFSTSTP